jgi:hypothetical protein
MQCDILQCDAFNVITTNASYSPTDAIVSRYGTFNTTSGSLQASSDSFYWFSFGAEIPANTLASISLLNTNSFRISKTHTNFTDSDIVTRSGVIRLQAGSTVSLVSVYPTLHTYWCGFRLDTLFNPLIAFFAASYTKTMNAGTVTFNNSLINEGGAWNDSASAFTAPVSGIYFFTFSGGVSANKRPLIRLVLNNITVVATAQFGGGGLIKPGGGPGVDVVSRSILLQLNESDVLQMISPQSANMPLYSDIASMATSISGFLYNPIGCTPVRPQLIDLCPCLVFITKTRVHLA